MKKRKHITTQDIINGNTNIGGTSTGSGLTGGGSGLTGGGSGLTGGGSGLTGGGSGLTGGSSGLTGGGSGLTGGGSGLIGGGSGLTGGGSGLTGNNSGYQGNNIPEYNPLEAHNRRQRGNNNFGAILRNLDMGQIIKVLLIAVVSIGIIAILYTLITNGDNIAATLSDMWTRFISAIFMVIFWSVFIWMLLIGTIFKALPTKLKSYLYFAILVLVILGKIIPSMGQAITYIAVTVGILAFVLKMIINP